MTDTLLATTTDAAAIAEVRAQFDAECGYPGPELPCADGSRPPPGCPCRVLHALDVDVIDDGTAPRLYAHPMPSKPLAVALAARIVVRTGEQVAALRAAAVAAAQAAEAAAEETTVKERPA